jgi:hypothetical protein
MAALASVLTGDHCHHHNVAIRDREPPMPMNWKKTAIRLFAFAAL